MDHSRTVSFPQTDDSSHHAASLRAPDRSPTPTDLPSRKYEVMYLDHTGQLREKTLLSQAHAAFDEAFSVLKQGAIVHGENGFVSVEDVYPGDSLRIADGSYQTVQWRGSLVVGPETEAATGTGEILTRITSDALGYNRPSPDLVLGHGARILHRAAGIRRVASRNAAFIPAADFVDGNNVLSLRPTTLVTLMQFGFDQQQSLNVNGIEVETLHPGSAFNLGLRGASLRAFMSLFPHKYSFEDFGLLRTPRLRLRDLELLG